MTSIAAAIPARPTTARGLYADGYRAAVDAMTVLAEQLDRDAFRRVAQTNVIPVHVTGRTDYEHGASDAWAGWLTNDRRRFLTRQAALSEAPCGCSNPHCQA